MSDKAGKTYRQLIRRVQQSNVALGEKITKGRVETSTFEPDTLKRLKQLGYLEGTASDHQRYVPEPLPAVPPEGMDSDILFFNNLERYLEAQSDIAPAGVEAEYKQIRSSIESIYQQADKARKNTFYSVLNAVPVSEVVGMLLETDDRKAVVRRLIDMAGQDDDKDCKELFFERVERYIMSQDQVEPTVNRQRFETICSAFEDLFSTVPESCRKRVLDYSESVPVEYIVLSMENDGREYLKQIMVWICR